VTASLRADRPRLVRHLGFGVSLVIGLGIAAFIYLVLAISECLPRDGSAEMQVCDAIKRRDFWLYPVLLSVSVAASLWLHLRGAAGTWLLAITSGLTAAIALMVVNALSG
jgi:hypothetical protein